MKNKVNIDTVGWLWGASVGRVWLTERAHILETEDNKRGGVQNSSLTLLEDIRGGGAYVLSTYCVRWNFAQHLGPAMSSIRSETMAGYASSTNIFDKVTNHT